MASLYEPLRPVRQEEIDTFWRQGFVCLRGIIPQDWIARMQRAVDGWLQSPECLDYTAFGADVAGAAGAEVMLAAGERRGRFYSGQDHWRSLADFREFALRSPLAGICSDLLRSTRLNLYEDSVLVKEPGALDKTAFHQDISYFHVEGHQICTTWVPLDPVRAETGSLQFIPGSHLWKKKYRPNFFITDLMMPGTEGETVPDFHKAERSNEVVSFDMEPGDMTVHHARTIHGADGNTSQHTRAERFQCDIAGMMPVTIFAKAFRSSPIIKRLGKGKCLITRIARSSGRTRCENRSGVVQRQFHAAGTRAGYADAFCSFA